MTGIFRARSIAGLLLIVLCATIWAGHPGPAGAADIPAAAISPHPASASTESKLDRSGRARVGKASFYAKKFAGRKMADGKRMSPQADNAASRTLPLGTRAKVTNLETGRSAEIDIQDRGPYAKGRIVDLSPSTAQKLGIDRKRGVADVKVAPVTVPQSDGSVKPGAGAKDKGAAPP